MTQRPRRPRRSSWLARLLTWGGISLILHALLFAVLVPIWPHLQPPETRFNPRPVTLVVLEPEEEEPEPPEEEKPDWDGQLVDLPEPVEQEKPDDADYLAEHNRVVEEETRTDKFRVNPEVLAPEYSPDDKLQFEDLMDVGAEEFSTGAKVGNDRFDPDQHGALASIPSPFQLTNRDGLQKPSRASSSTQSLAGAPNNDLLDEELGDGVYLNTKEFLYAGYINQIRRLVNFYWQQNLDNLPPAARAVWAKSRYETVVHVTLTTEGTLAGIEILQECGSGPLDEAVVSAFKIAGPYPAPPDGLVSKKDGLAHLGNMGFTVAVGQANAAYMGIDPRAGVQFPGILKSPR